MHEAEPKGAATRPGIVRDEASTTRARSPRDASPSKEPTSRAVVGADGTRPDAGFRAPSFVTEDAIAQDPDAGASLDEARRPVDELARDLGIELGWSAIGGAVEAPVARVADVARAIDDELRRAITSSPDDARSLREGRVDVARAPAGATARAIESAIAPAWPGVLDLPSSPDASRSSAARGPSPHERAASTASPRRGAAAGTTTGDLASKNGHAPTAPAASAESTSAAVADDAPRGDAAASPRPLETDRGEDLGSEPTRGGAPAASTARVPRGGDGSLSPSASSEASDRASGAIAGPTGRVATTGRLDEAASRATDEDAGVTPGATSAASTSSVAAGADAAHGAQARSAGDPHEQAPQTAADAAREQRQTHAEVAVSRMTLQRGVKADAVLPDLGRVTVEARGRTDALDVRLTAERGETASILAAQGHEMRADLDKSSVNVTELSIGLASGGAGQGGSAGREDPRERGSARTSAVSDDPDRATREAHAAEIQRQSRRVRIVL
jgi:hypothetical protein